MTDCLTWRETEFLPAREERLFAADCAESVLYIFEEYYPDDNRPRLAIDAARAYARGEIGKDTLKEIRKASHNSSLLSRAAESGRAAAKPARGAAKDARAISRAATIRKRADWSAKTAREAGMAATSAATVDLSLWAVIHFAASAAGMNVVSVSQEIHGEAFRNAKRTEYEKQFKMLREYFDALDDQREIK